ncbi:LysM peptidoglycan-binding domain-containing protein [Vibrio sp. E150_011]
MKQSKGMLEMRQRIFRLVRGLALFSLTLFFAFPGQSNELRLKSNVPSTYVVVKGDTLWGISTLYLRSPWRWPELWGYNQHVTNPHLIYPGDKFNLTWVDGRPRLSIKSVKTLSPVVRIDNKRPIAGADRLTVMRYLEKEGLVNSKVLESFPVVVGSNRGLDYVTDRDELYIQYQGRERTWGIYRVGKAYSNHLGADMKEVRLLAEAHTIGHNNGVTTLQISSLKRELKKGDVVIPLSAHQDLSLASNFSPRPGPSIDTVKLLGAMNSLNYAVQGQTVVLNIGTMAGVEQGSIFLIKRNSEDFRFSAGEKSIEKKDNRASLSFPKVEIGQLMVIRPYEHFSIAVITTSTEPVSMQAIIEAPNMSHSVDWFPNTDDAIDG